MIPLIVIAALAWVAAAYFYACRQTKTLVYALIGIASLVFIGIFWVFFELNGRTAAPSSFPLIVGIIIFLLRSSSPKHEPSYREYASPRDILLFRKPGAPIAAEQPAGEGWRVPRAEPVRPHPAQIALMTVIGVVLIGLLLTFLRHL